MIVKIYPAIISRINSPPTYKIPEIKALDNVLLTGYKTYPSNPFTELEKTPSGYTNGNDSGLDDAWWFTANKVYHRRNGNVYFWDYNPLNGEIN